MILGYVPGYTQVCSRVPSRVYTLLNAPLKPSMHVCVAMHWAEPYECCFGSIQAAVLGTYVQDSGFGALSLRFSFESAFHQTFEKREA